MACIPELWRNRKERYFVDQQVAHVRGRAVWDRFPVGAYVQWEQSEERIASFLAESDSPVLLAEEAVVPVDLAVGKREFEMPSRVSRLSEAAD